MGCASGLSGGKINLHRVEQRNPEIEERLNLHLGRPYIVEQRTVHHDVYDHRPAVDGKPYHFHVKVRVFEGVLEQVYIHLCEEGFIPLDIMLAYGFSYLREYPDQKDPFRYERLLYGDPYKLGLCRFGRIEDESEFERARDSAYRRF